jgi:hypothetical protein
MQTYISDSKNEDKIYRIKQALLNLDRWDFAEGPIEVPTGGYVEPFPGQDYTLWGCLSWTHHWYIRPASKRNLIHYSNIGQSRTGRSRRKTPLSKLFKLQHYEDYSLGIDPDRLAREDWLPYIKDYLEKLKKERELRHPSYVFLFPSDKDVEDLLLRVASFTLREPILDTVLDQSQTVPVENSAGENPVQ